MFDCSLNGKGAGLCDSERHFDEGRPAAPEGVAQLNADHPDVAIFSAGLDRELNDRKYILPGLGDFGDRLYGTL